MSGKNVAKSITIDEAFEAWKVLAQYEAENAQKPFFAGLCYPKNPKLKVEYARLLKLRADPNVASGSSTMWNKLVDFVCARDRCTSIVVEAKTTAGASGAPEFMRMCGILSLAFSDGGGMGVFFAMDGASGFERRKRGPKRVAHDARLIQLLFYSRYDVPIVVFDSTDIGRLSEAGSLPQPWGRQDGQRHRNHVRPSYASSPRGNADASPSTVGSRGSTVRQQVAGFRVAASSQLRFSGSREVEQPA